jgi:ribosome-associated heat shock protein Hsp15
MKDSEREPVGGVRLDRWLWAARFYKTRATAVEAIDGGKVQVAGDRVKRAKTVRVGDEIRMRQGPYEQIVLVRKLSERRGPATEAVTLYEETAASKAAREKMALQLKAVHSAFIPDDNARPTKRDRRKLEKLRGRE